MLDFYSRNLIYNYILQAHTRIHKDYPRSRTPININSIFWACCMEYLQEIALNSLQTVHIMSLQWL